VDRPGESQEAKEGKKKLDIAQSAIPDFRLLEFLSLFN
jgi:hypothetical protein